MRTPQQLPAPLRRRAFTRSQLPEWGIHPERVRRRDIVPLGAGAFAHRDLVADADQVLLHRLQALALAREFPHGWLSHSTAAGLLDRCSVPASCRDGLVHISVPATSPEITREGIRCHRVLNNPAAVFEVPGIPGVRLSTPARFWLELASTGSISEVVALGDSLVREPYSWAEQRTEPYTSLQGLRTAVEQAKGFRGRRTAMHALPLIRVGADSAKETAFRLALRQAGFPEPELQILRDPSDPRSRRGDLGYRSWKLVIQYDGKTHYTPQRHRADQRRDNDWVADGWLTLGVNVEDDRDGFGTAVGQVGAALHSRGYRRGLRS